MLPLENITIIDMTRVLAGPYCTMMLGDFGANIIKVEIPGRGDDSRGLGPFANGESAYFMGNNRNKKSITVDLKNEGGKEVLRKLLEKADAVVENFRPGTMEKLGFGYEDIIQYNKDIVYVACSGYGHTGPYSKRASYDAIVQGQGGIMSITGKEPGDFTRVGISIGDYAAGLFSAIGALVALYHKKNTGEGQKVDVAMLDCQLALLDIAVARYLINGTVPQPLGNGHATTTPHMDFPCKDGTRVYLVIGNNNLWSKFCNAVGRPEWITDERFLTNDIRHQHVDELYALLGELFLTKEAAEWVSIVDGAGVPIGYLNTIDKIVCDEQIIAREMLVETEHPIGGKLKFVDTPIKMSKSKGGYRRHAPLLGADTDDILKSYLHMNEKEIQALRDMGAI